MLRQPQHDMVEKCLKRHDNRMTLPFNSVSVDRPCRAGLYLVYSAQPESRAIQGHFQAIQEGFSLDPTDLAQLVVEVASDKLAADIVLLDLRGVAPFADYFVIMSAESSRQIEALERDISQALKEEKVRRFNREGVPSAGWVLLDFSDVIVHIFGPEEREYYGLERLWSQAPQVVRVL